MRYDLAIGKGVILKFLLDRKKIKKIPRLQCRDFEWNKDQMETLGSSLAL